MKRPSPAIVISCLALFVALGGTSYAAIKLPKNSVGGKQIKKNAVTSAKVKNGSLLTKDFKSGQIPAGAKGDKGDKGDPGVLAARFASSSSVPLTSSAQMTVVLGEAIVSDVPLRLIINGAVDNFNQDGAQRSAYCNAQTSSDGGAWIFTPTGASESDVLASGGDAMIPVIRGIDLNAGTHNVRIACWTPDGTNVHAWKSHLNVTAVRN
jgi:hypothetical protein